MDAKQFADFCEGATRAFVEGFNDAYRHIYDMQLPYVPPCERDPWYDDPRDVKPTELELRRCERCGTYFQPYIDFRVGSVAYCPDCLDKVYNEKANNLYLGSDADAR